MAKRALRASMTDRRAGVSATEATACARAVADRLVATGAWQTATRVALYAALPGELPTGPLAEAAATAGRPLLWPRVAGELLEFAVCATSELVAGTFGIMEPPRAARQSPFGPGDLVVVPALAFDARGARLGRGGGDYDRALRSLPQRASSVAIGYDFQRVASVPTEAHDVAVDLVVTEAGVYGRIES